MTAFSVIYRRHLGRRSQSSSAQTRSSVMGKKKPPKRASPPKIPIDAPASVSTGSASSKSAIPIIVSASHEEAIASQDTASVSKLQDPTSDQSSGSGKPNTVATVESAKVATATNPVTSQISDDKEEGEISPAAKIVPVKEAQIPAETEDNKSPSNPNSDPAVGEETKNLSSDEPAKPDLWTGLFKGTMKKLQKRGESFLLPSGESCVTIPNSVIENNRKSWDSFIIGQFYSDPPSQGTIQKIVNGIWSKRFADITVSKMEGFAFLFRIPNASTRAHVLKQCLWQIEGQTMFVAKWEPGIVPTKPELTTAPIWLELRDVPLQFFNEEALEQIASQIGDPKFLHPQTANKTNLEVAKVFTIIDPRVPLPEAVNARFESGEIRRIKVSSPWMPPVCSFCKEVGHSLKRCKKAPITCKVCKSTGHPESECTRSKGKSQAKPTANQKPVYVPKEQIKPALAATHNPHPSPSLKTAQPALKNMEKGETSVPAGTRSKVPRDQHPPDCTNSETSPAESDSSDQESSDSQPSDDSGFQEVFSARQKKRIRGRGPKNI